MGSERTNTGTVERDPVAADPRVDPGSAIGAAAAEPAVANSSLRLLTRDRAPDSAGAGGPVLPETTLEALEGLTGESIESLLIDDAGAADRMWLEQALRASLRAVTPGGTVVLVCAIAGDAGDSPTAVLHATRTRIVSTLQQAIPPGAARIERFDVFPGAESGLLPQRLTLIVRKHGERPQPGVTPLRTSTDRAEATFPFRRDAAVGQLAPGMRLHDGVLVRDFRRGVGPVRRILLLQLAHFGDFIIALPAMREVRRRFPDAHIRLVCGQWNIPPAAETGVLDEIRGYSYFPQQSRGWNGVPVEDMSAFAAATEGHFDIAIDLRVDEDTRHLLARVDATLRCGIGSQQWFPGLNVALPTEHSKRANTTDRERVIWLAAERFSTTLRTLSPFNLRRRVTRSTQGHVVFGPYVMLQPGEYSAWFDLSAHPFFGSIGTLAVLLEVVRDGEVIASRTYHRGHVREIGSIGTEIGFDSGPIEAKFEFRVHVSGRHLGVALDFRGVRLHLDEKPTRVNYKPKFRPVEIHVGEQLSLLVALVHARACELYDDAEQHDPAPNSPLARRVAGLLGPGPAFLIVPVSNSTIRNWPLPSYIGLVRLLLRKPGATVIIVGAQSQAAEAASIVASADDPARVINLTGQTNWTDLPDVLRVADLVICNNSGVAHQAASLGRPTLGIYSGSHQPPEWGPRGPRSRAIMAPVRCSPCGLEILEQCEHGHVCMTLLTPEIVLHHVDEMLAANPPRARSGPV